MYKYVFAKAKKDPAFIINARDPYVFSDEREIVIDKKENLEIAKKEAGIPDSYLCVAVKMI